MYITVIKLLYVVCPLILSVFLLFFVFLSCFLFVFLLFFLGRATSSSQPAASSTVQSSAASTSNTSVSSSSNTTSSTPSAPSSLSSSQPLRAASSKPSPPSSNSASMYNLRVSPPASSSSSPVPPSPNSANSNSSYDVPLTAICYENQRYYPVVGWSRNLFPNDPPPWSDNEGNMKEFQDFKVPPGWSWGGEWTIQRGEEKEAKEAKSDVKKSSSSTSSTSSPSLDGWEYSSDFSRPFSSTPCHGVRRRQWYRVRVPPRRVNNLPTSNSLTLSLSYKSTLPIASSSTIGKNTFTNNGNNGTRQTRAPTNAVSLAELYAKQVDPLDYKQVKGITKKSAGEGIITSLQDLSSLAPATANANNASQLTQPISVVVWEHQRYYPLVGWSDRLLPTDKKFPWSYDDGNKTFKKEAVLPGEKYKWINEWEVLIDAELSDNEGWQYIVDFSNNFKYHNKRGLEFFCRRRGWSRKKIMRAEAIENEKQKQNTTKPKYM